MGIRLSGQVISWNANAQISFSNAPQDIDGDYNFTGTVTGISGGGGGGTWGSITGTLSDQTDLNNALALKAPLNSPTLVTPVLGVATVTSINKLTITAPSSNAVLTIANGKTLTISNTLTFAGTDSSSVAFGAGGTVAFIANKLSVFAATTSAELASVISDETGSGLLVFATSPTLTTPLLGTPTSGVLTNCTGLPLASIANLGSGIATFLGTPSSANLASALTDETGTGNVVFSASPTFTGAALSSATLGSEEIPALSAGNWTVGSGWESPIVGPGLIKNANGTGTQTPSAATTIIAGTTYKIVIVLSAASVGSATYTLGGTPGNQTLSAVTTYTDYVVATTTGKLIVTPTSTSRFTISSISIKAISSAGSHVIEGTLQVSGTTKLSGIQTLENLATIYGQTSAGVFSRILGIDTTILKLGTDVGGETPLVVQVLGGNSSNSIKFVTNAVTAMNFGVVSVGNSTIAAAIGGANVAQTDTLNISDRGSNNHTTLSIDASPLDSASDSVFSITKTDRTTKTRKIARDGYELTYNNTTVAGTGLPHIPNIVALTGQTASITTTNIQPTVGGSAGVPPAGLYRVIVEMIVTTAGTSGTVACTIGWNDGAAARTSTPASTLTFGSLVRSSGAEYLTCDGTTNLTYLTTVTAAVGSPVYSLKITLERLQ